MGLKVYYYDKCGTCKKALKWLDERVVGYMLHPIREKPPTKKELKEALKAVGDSRKLFNVSGQDYRKMDLKSRLPSMSDAERIDLLAQNGNLIKRPFVVGDGVRLVGFDAETWAEALGGWR